MVWKIVTHQAYPIAAGLSRFPSEFCPSARCILEQEFIRNSLGIHSIAAKPQMNLRMNFATTDPCGPHALQRYRVRMSAALALSLLFHAFLLSLQFGIRGLGLPGLHMPWEERRARTPGITVRIADVRRKDSPGMAGAPERRPAEAGAPAPDMPVPSASKALAETAPAASPAPSSGMKVVRRTEASAVAARGEERKAVPAKPHRKAQPARRVRRPVPQAKPKPRPPIVAKKPMQQDASVLPFPHTGEAAEQPPAADEHVAETPVAAIAPVEEPHEQPQEPAEAARTLREAEDARRAEESAAKRLEDERHLMELEAQRQAAETVRQASQRQAEEEQARLAKQSQAQRLAEENAQRQAAELEARRQAEEAARQAAQRIEEEQRLREQLHVRQQQAKMLEEENARRQAMEEQARRQAMEQLAEAQRQEAARAQRLAEEQAQRLAEEAARQQDAASAGQQHLGAEGAQDRPQGAPAGEHGGSPGAQQTEHAHAPTETPAQAAIMEKKSSGASETDDGPIALSDEQMASMRAGQVRKVDVTRLEPQAARELANADRDSRRRTIFGGAEDDIVLKMYIADWLQAVERNGKLDEEASLQDKQHGDSLVTVALRSDGRVESVIIHRSNGRAGLNEAVRRIVHAEARYNAFPPELMRRYDVIEIRRIWKFGDGLRILEEAR